MSQCPFSEIPAEVFGFSPKLRFIEKNAPLILVFVQIFKVLQKQVAMTNSNHSDCKRN